MIPINIVVQINVKLKKKKPEAGMFFHILVGFIR